MMEWLMFAIFSGLAIISGLGLIFLRDPVRAALSLIACFFSISCLFLLQSAEFIAVLEILVYAGAIMVLFVFVIMLVEDRNVAVIPVSSLSKWISLPLRVVGVAIVTFGMFSSISRVPFANSVKLPDGFGSVRSVGTLLFEEYLFHFEITSLLLLVGIVGAVIVSRRQT